MGTSVDLIRSENFEREVFAEKKPVLLLCMPRDEEFPQQLKLMEDIAAKYGRDRSENIIYWRHPPMVRPIKCC